MIVSETSVEQHGLLDQTLPADLGHKIDVFLGAGGAHGDVM
jgi:tryptophan synthase beta subunit